MKEATANDLRAGMPSDEVAALLSNLRAALGWIASAAGEDGFLSYIDHTGKGLANQGWKDTGDAVQWRDGRLAEGPITLCEVQGYAHEAAAGAADLLEAFGEGAPSNGGRGPRACASGSTSGSG